MSKPNCKKCYFADIQEYDIGAYRLPVISCSHPDFKKDTIELSYNTPISCPLKLESKDE